MNIYDIHAEKSNNEYKVIATLESAIFGKDVIWFSVPNAYCDYLTVDRYDAFMVAMLYPAMKYREDIHIEGTISYQLYRNIVTYVQAILMAYSPGLKRISITADNYIGEKINTSNMIGTGFSGGVDSFCTLYDYFILEKDDKYRINGLVMLNVGSHGKISEDNNTKEKFLNRYYYLSHYTEDVNLPFVPLDSNIHYYHKEYGHQKTVALTLASGVLALQKKFSKYYVASAIDYANMMIFGKNSKDLSLAEYSESYLLPLLGTESLQFISDGQQYTRSEKILHILGYPPVKKYLNVCVGNHADEKNCSVCSKCLRTQMTLESADKLNEFSDIFNLEKYRRKKFLYKCRQRILYNTNPFAKDNIDFARKSGKYVPSLITAIIFEFPFLIKLFIIKMFKTIFGNEQYQIIRNKLKDDT
jgi:hypothetical protein